MFMLLFSSPSSILLLSRFVVGCEPRQPLVQPVPRRGARGLHVPIPVADAGQTELLLDLVGLHGWKRIGFQLKQ